MSITGPDFVSLPVENLDSAVDFYQTILGLKRINSKTPGEAIFATHPIPLSVREHSGGSAAKDMVPDPHAKSIVWLHATDLQDLYAKLLATNAPIHRPPTMGRFGSELTFSDPSGNVITVHERG